MDRQVVGWPDPARVVIFREWMRSFPAIWSRISAFGMLKGSFERGPPL